MEVIQEAISRREAELYADQKAALDAVHAFIRRNKLMVHGGTAVSAMLFDEDRRDLCGGGIDYDVLVRTLTAKGVSNLAYELQAELSELGFRSNFKGAVHDGTVKLFAVPRSKKATEQKSYREVVDLTALAPAEYDALLALSKKESKLVTDRLLVYVPVVYVKMGAHLEFSRPQAHVARWLKVFPRVSALYKRFPSVDVHRASRHGLPAKPREGGSTAVAPFPGKAARESGWVVVGHEALKRILRLPHASLPPPPHAVEFVIRRGGAGGVPGLQPGVSEGGLVLPPHGTAADGGVFYLSEDCDAYNEAADGTLVGSPDLVLRFMYARYIMFPRERAYLEVAIDALTAQMEAALRRNSGLSKRFVVECMRE